MNEYVANAKIVLVEWKENGWSKTICRVVGTAITDGNGECTFSKARLRRGISFDYFCAVKESWGLQQAHSCNDKINSFIEKGKTEDWFIIDDAKGYFKVQYTNLLNPSQAGDSLNIKLKTIDYIVPEVGIVHGGAIVFSDLLVYNLNSPPNYPSMLLREPILINGQRLLREIRKRKMGKISTSVDTIKVYPNQTTFVVVEW